MSETAEVITVRSADRVWYFLKSAYKFRVSDGILYIINKQEEYDLVVSGQWSCFVDEQKVS